MYNKKNRKKYFEAERKKKKNKISDKKLYKQYCYKERVNKKRGRKWGY